MKRLFSFALLTMMIAACNNNDSKTHAALSKDGDDAFRSISDSFIAGYLNWRPQSAVALGYHEYDGKITDYSKASLDNELKRLKNFDHQLDGFDTASLSTQNYFDFRLLRMGIKNEIFNFEDLRIYTRNPMTYAGAVDVNMYIKRDYAPLEERLKHVIAVEKEIPRVLAAANENLAGALPKPYIQTAIEIAKGNADFLKGDLLTALKDVKNDSLMANFKLVNDSAVAAINNFVAYLQKEKLSTANNDYAIGEASYKRMLLFGEAINLAPDSILAIGIAELKREQENFNAAAKIIDPNKKPIDVFHDVQKEHPVADSLIPEAKKQAEAIRQFLSDKKIVTMPSEVRVQIKETPQYARATSTASMDVPGPFEKKATEAYYYITHVDPKWTPKQKEEWLTSFDYYTTENVTIHEAYPGHYTQFLHLNASNASQLEKIFGSYAFIEGWAHYCEVMMINEGYGNNGDPIKAAKHRLAQSGDALLRICRLYVSLKMHCHGMTLEEGTKFFMDNWYQGEKPSSQEALRGTFDPGYLFYTVGKLEILKLREDYKKQEGSNYSLQKFHDSVLDHGMMPIRLLREILLKDPATWNNIL